MKTVWTNPHDNVTLNSPRAIRYAFVAPVALPARIRAIPTAASRATPVNRMMTSVSRRLGSSLLARLSHSSASRSPTAHQTQVMRRRELPSQPMSVAACQNVKKDTTTPATIPSDAESATRTPARGSRHRQDGSVWELTRENYRETAPVRCGPEVTSTKNLGRHWHATQGCSGGAGSPALGFAVLCGQGAADKALLATASLKQTLRCWSEGLLTTVGKCAAFQGTGSCSGSQLRSRKVEEGWHCTGPLLFCPGPAPRDEGNGCSGASRDTWSPKDVLQVLSHCPRHSDQAPRCKREPAPLSFACPRLSGIVRFRVLALFDPSHPLAWA